MVITGGQGQVAQALFENPILNSPYEEPTRHHALDRMGQPTDATPVAGGERRS